MDPKVSQFLNKNYARSEAARKDIKAATTAYRGLSSQIRNFVFNNGTEKELVCLDGTVPVPYKSNTYNIPICIWLLDTHPTNAPMVFVTPTSGMKIKVSRHVDHNGLVYLPYLHTWSGQTSNLLDLVKVMVGVFSEQPPVYAVPKEQPTPANLYGSQPMMPMPGSGTPVYNTPYPSYNQPYPPYPTGQVHGAAHTAPYPTGNAGVFPPYPTSSPFPAPYPNQPQQSNNQLPPMGNGAGIPAEHVRASLLSAVEDKIRRKLNEMSAAAQAEMETMRRTGHELAKGKETLEAMLKRLESEQVEIDRNISILTEKEAELDKLVSKHGDDTAIDVDNAVITTAPIYKQLLNAYAEEAATEDAIYYLGEALRRDVIDVEVFLKHARSLSRKQFFLRALMEKCRQKAGLAV